MKWWIIGSSAGVALKVAVVILLIAGLQRGWYGQRRTRSIKRKIRKMPVVGTRAARWIDGQ